MLELWLVWGGSMDSSSSTQILGPLLSPLAFATSLKPSQQQSLPSAQTSHYILAAKGTRGRQGWGRKIGGIEIKAVSLRLASSQSWSVWEVDLSQQPKTQTESNRKPVNVNISQIWAPLLIDCDTWEDPLSFSQPHNKVEVKHLPTGLSWGLDMWSP